MEHALDSVLSLISDSSVVLQFLISAILAALTEEWSAVAVFGLARVGKIPWAVAVGSVYVGTLTINIGLWAAGRATGTRALHWKMFRGLSPQKLERLHLHVRREGWIAVAVSRFLPGTRIPVFVLSGILGMDARAYLLTQVVATAAWILATLGLIHIVVGLAGENPWLLAAVVAGILAVGVVVWKARRR